MSGVHDDVHSLRSDTRTTVRIIMPKEEVAAQIEAAKSPVFRCFSDALRPLIVRQLPSEWLRGCLSGKKSSSKCLRECSYGQIAPCR